MKFRLNDKVSVLDDDLSGHVIEISADTITIETTSGFEMSFAASELVKIKIIFSIHRLFQVNPFKIFFLKKPQKRECNPSRTN